MPRRLTLAALVVGLGLLVLAPVAQAAISQNTIDRTVPLSGHGRYALVSGPIACTAGETLTIRITLTQPATGTQGQGRALFTCTGHLQTWVVTVPAFGASAFALGPAAACAHGSTSVGDSVTGERHWCAKAGVSLVAGD